MEDRSDANAVCFFGVRPILFEYYRSLFNTSPFQNKAISNFIFIKTVLIFFEHSFSYIIHVYMKTCEIFLLSLSATGQIILFLSYEYGKFYEL
jgi:hypothetical protein